jgi:hypothetical protein
MEVFLHAKYVISATDGGTLAAKKTNISSMFNGLLSDALIPRTHRTSD